ncbi:MAG: M13 family metallopeptidase [Ferruginibacter sp.]
MRLLSTAVLYGAVLLTVSCNNKSQKTSEPVSYIDSAGMDRSVSPGDDFYTYVNGGRVKSTAIPDDQSAWGTFHIVYEENQKKLKGILEDAAKAGAAKGSLEQKVGDYYMSGMDTVAIEKAGIQPLQPMLAKINAVQDAAQLISLVQENYLSGDGSLLGFSVSTDDKNSRQNIVHLSQSGLSLPSKEYYLNNDAASVNIRNSFQAYIKKMFMMTGTDSITAGKNAHDILALETELARSHRTPVELRDAEKNYHKISVQDLSKQMPALAWPGFFSKLQVSTDSVDLRQPEYFTTLNQLLVSQPVALWKAKLQYDYIAANARLLTKAFRDADFEYNKVFSGAKKQQDRWKTMVSRVDAGLPELLGQLFVQKYFTPEAKKKMGELVDNLQKAFEVRINALDWMSDSTKLKATAKLNAFLKKIGYPDKWKNYDDVTIDRNNFFANAKSIQAHNQKEMIGKIGKPVDKSEWDMSPPTVNAYYNPSFNEIVFPAGVLERPFFSLTADDAINYGAIGLAIGHEMTHGFDDEGSKYDADGNLKNWWTAADGEKFRAKTKVLADQYNRYVVLDSVHVNGSLTLGENIADLGGLAIAYDAFKMTPQGKSGDKIDGLTPDQRFFISFGQLWRTKYRDELLRTLINVDPHSPTQFRVNGPLVNFDPFYKAFDLKEGDKMYLKPENRAKIW